MKNFIIIAGVLSFLLMVADVVGWFLYHRAGFLFAAGLFFLFNLSLVFGIGSGKKKGGVR